jgi:tripeptidyl-peptidase I
MVGPNLLVRLALAVAVPCNAAANMRMVDTVQKDALLQRGWAVQRTPAAEEQITLQIGLTLQNQDALINKLKEVSDPKGPNYGKYLDKAEVEALAKPSLDATDKVTRWLKDAGVETVSANGAWVTFRTSISKANELLSADFVQYHNDGVSKIRTAAYSVPQDVMEHIDLIHPTTFFGKTQAFRPVHIADGAAKLFDEPFVAAVDAIEPRQTRSRVDASCKQNITPNCLKQMYNVGDYKPDAKSGSKIGFGSFLNETSSVEDLKLYTKKFGIPDQSVTKTTIEGGVDDQQRESGEANLDAQNMVGIGHPLPVYEYITGGSPPFVPDLDLPEGGTNTNEPYLPYYQYLMGKSNAELPQAISNSYGEPEHTVPKNYAMRTCLMVAMMGVRGISVFESSGDTGIGSNCLSNDGQKRKEFNPQFPGTCPWITSVGGTEVCNAYLLKAQKIVLINRTIHRLLHPRLHGEIPLEASPITSSVRGTKLTPYKQYVTLQRALPHVQSQFPAKPPS